MWMEGGDLMLSGKAAAYAGGAAVAGGVARWIADGDYRFKTFAQKVVSGLVGWCAIVAISVVAPNLTDNLWAFGATCFLSGFLVEPILKIVFWRFEHADISVNFGPIKADSDGKANDE